MNENVRKLKSAIQRHGTIMHNMIPAVRAATNAMVDANMKATAAPLQEALFELDACSQEIRDVINNPDPEVAAYVLLGITDGR